MFPMWGNRVGKVDYGGLEMDNKGSSVVELSIIMPVIISILIMVIFLFVDTIRDGLVQQDGYSVIYTYQEKGGWKENSGQMRKNEESEETHAVISDGLCRFEKEGHVFVTEVGVCSNRLRRWQVYGNIVWE